MQPFHATAAFSLAYKSSVTCTAIVLAAIASTPFSIKCSSITCWRNSCVLISRCSISCRTFAWRSIGIFPQIFFISIVLAPFFLLAQQYSNYAKKAIHNTQQTLPSRSWHNQQCMHALNLQVAPPPFQPYPFGKLNSTAVILQKKSGWHPFASQPDFWF